MKATIYIRLKEDVLDPAGEALVERLTNMGFPEIMKARIGKLIELELHAADKENVQTRVDQMCQKLISNPLIEEYQVAPID